VTHDDSESHQEASDVDEHLLAELPAGIHFDSLEAKWVLIGVVCMLVLGLTGSTELLAVVGPIALGGRATQRLPKLQHLEAQPWWWLGGLLVGYPIALALRVGLQAAGVALPDLDWVQTIELTVRLLGLVG
jgi:hypothetical protein